MNMSIALLLIFFGLAVLGIPLAISLGVAGAATLMIFTDIPVGLVAQSMFSSMNSFLMVAVPLFILVGLLMEKSGVADRIFSFSNALVGWLPGGLGHVNVLTSMVFGGISGSSVADIASIGRVEIYAMTKSDYSKSYAVALTLVTSALASIIPPSILMIIAGSIANQSIGLLLVAGVVPGTFIGAAFMIYNHIYTTRRGMGTRKAFDFNQMIKKGLVAFPALLTPAILLWGIIGGYFTPTEAAGVAVIYTIVLAVIVYRQIGLRDILHLMFQTAKMTGTILFIAVTAKMAAWIFTYDGLPVRVAEFLSNHSASPTLVFLMIFAFLVMVGMFMDAVAALFILIPVLLPAVSQIGIDPVHFVVVTVIALAMGLVTPPVGVCLFAAAQVTGMPIEQIIKSSLPLFIVLGVSVLILVIFPNVILWPIKLLGMY